MRVLLTGHEGYIGTVLAVRLREAGHDVVGLDTGFFADCILGPAPAEIPGLRLDLRDVTPEPLAGFDAVMHLAALCNDPIGNLNPQLTYEINHRATVRLADAARTAGVTRFLFSSSCSLYGAGLGDNEGGDEGDRALTDRPFLDENAGFAPVTPYGESKILSEQDITGLATDDFSPTFLRNATAYGFSPRLRGDIVVNDLTASALLTGQVRLLSDGRAWRPLIHVEDIAAAFVALLEAPREVVHGKAYNIAQTSENYLIRDVAELVAEVVPGSRVTFADNAATDLRDYRVSGDLVAAEVPGFKPQWTVRTGAEQLLEAYQRHGLTEEAFRGKFQRIRRIQQLTADGRVDGELRWSA
ncbi:MAG: SDR family oxidoreductase [Hamadaea sp.]|uniref:NAD-dependent epimerase/dehydratase family protein n=1 Tax=Hamadaea sp. TaxID=2024425 RepID=UPI0017EAAB37|nr:SDR family oxidoreductase [Hamadaea sp.]NUR70145.1 SDR family oxidoreductase [Hamadaea sp.]NUT23541.1 SDR family oxidoreductase [Hamadaea sp.]